MTTPQRWQEIDRIFAEALEREPAERVAFLDQACGDDQQLRKEVDSLLAHDTAASLFNKETVAAATRLLASDAGQGLPNKNIGPYQIVRSLGAGGMGHVYLAHDKRLNRPVAVKLLSFYDVAAEERIRRFRQEALAASALNHPNILTIYEIGESEGHNFIATEFIDGQTLLSLISEGNVSVERALDIAIQTTSALSAAHAAGIIHRDIKPANIMLRADGLLKVLDFGIAKYNHPTATETNESLVQTAPGTVIGTAAYMSPEQARGKEIDQRTDIWSLGVILYELVAGQRPFSGETLMDVMSAVIERQPAPLSTHTPSVPEALQHIVSKSLQKEKEARYQTAAELSADLKELRQNLEQERAGKRADAQNSAAAAQSGTVALPAHPQTDSVRPGRTLEDERATTSSAEYVAGVIKHRKYPILVAILIVAAVGWLAYRSFFPNNTRQIESIAVMPFVNASGNSEVEYLSDGMTDMLITSLSQLPQLSVKARSSVFRYKGKDMPPQQVGKELNVQAILTGRVVQRGNDLTLHIELVSAQTETALWSRDYSRSLTNLVALQGELARDVSKNLRARLSGAEEQKVTKDYTANAEAYQLYLKGRFHVFKLTPPEIQKGTSYFQEAIRLDPNYALAYTGLSGAYRGLVLSTELPPMQFLPKAKEAAQKAVELDDALAEAHTALGSTMFWYDWQWNEAENQFKRALELNPNSEGAHFLYAHLLSITGRHDEALAEIRRATELEPYNPFANTLEGQFLSNAGKLDEALAKLRETSELAPGFWFPHVFAASIYIEKGMFAEAISEARRAKELSSAQTVSDVYEGYALAKWGKRDEAQAVLDNLLKLSKEHFVPPYHIAQLYNGLGEREQALAWLERAFEQHDAKMAFLKVDSKWNNLRSDPRFADLMKRMGLAQ